jgi:hypothetical protein
MLAANAIQITVHGRRLGISTASWAITTLIETKFVYRFATTFAYVTKTCHIVSTSLPFYQGFGEIK